MQSSYEVIKAAIEFTSPDRLPRVFDAFNDTDVKNVSWKQIGTGDHKLKLTFDEWHCGWSRSEVKNMGLVTVHPLDDWGKIDLFKWPDPTDPVLYNEMADQLENSEQKYLSTGIFMLLFERLHALRGFENTLVDLYLEREKIENLADRIVEYNLEIISQISKRFPGKIHGFSFSDDWGTEQELMINPSLWNEFFKPRYKKIFDACKNAGWHIWMHSCGKVNAIMSELIDIGLSAINLQQPRVLGIEKIGKQFAGKICFVSLCDIQNTLPFKDQAEIESEAKILLDHWGTANGGFILSDYGDGDAINVPIWKKKVMYDAFLRYDRWKNNNHQ